MQDAVPGTLTIFSHRMTVVRVLGSKFLLYHFGIKAVIILKYHGALIEPVYPIKEPASLSPWRLRCWRGKTPGERTWFMVIFMRTQIQIIGR